MPEVVAEGGPLPPSRLQWIADLYGPIDPWYRERAQLEHLFVDSPAGPALHAFALDAAGPVAHCAVVPMIAREGDRRMLVGKVEALVVAAAFRGRRAGGKPLAVELREALYELADARGIELLHAYVRPDVGRILDLAPIRAGAPSRVLVVRPRAIAPPRLRMPAFAVSLAQASLALALTPYAGASKRTLRTPASEDRDLVDAPAPPPGAWTVLAEDVWDWVRNAPSLRVFEPNDSRALVQIPVARGHALRLVAWRAGRPTLRGALHVLIAAASVARERGIATVRYEQWANDETSRLLCRACRLLGCVTRDDFATLYVRRRNAEGGSGAPLVPTPLVALGF